jgi:hypothetical protein
MKNDELSTILDAWPDAKPSPRFSARVLDAIDRSPPRTTPNWLLAAVAGVALLVGTASLWLGRSAANNNLVAAAAQNADLGEIHD